LTELREKIVSEIAQISESVALEFAADSEKTRYRYDSNSNKIHGRFRTFMGSIHRALYDARNDRTRRHPADRDWFNAVYHGMFGADLMTENNFGSPNLDHAVLRSVHLSDNGENIDFAIDHEVYVDLPDREEPVMKWVDVDKDTRVRQPVLDDDGKPKTKKIKSEQVIEQRTMRYSFSLDIVEAILTEIGQDSLINKPGVDYIPRPLGESMSRAFSGLSFAPMMSEYIMDMGGPRGRAPHPMMFMHPSRMMANFPFRMFLKPESGTDRMEVIIEPYPEEEVTAQHKLIRLRECWSAFSDLSDTAAVKAMMKLAQTNYDAQEKAKAAAQEKPTTKAKKVKHPS
jgi:hypothetical protein